MAKLNNKQLDWQIVTFLMELGINVCVGNEDTGKVCRDMELGTILVQSPIGEFYQSFIKWCKDNGHNYIDWCNRENIAPF